MSSIIQWAEEVKKHIPPGMQIFMKHGQSLILRDKIGYLYQLTYMQSKTERCSDNCGAKIRRWHFTCFHCHWGKIWRDRNIQYPYTKLEPVTLYLVFFRKNRKYKYLKDQITKKLLAIVERLAH